jgi:hypothetical protein
MRYPFDIWASYFIGARYRTIYTGAPLLRFVRKTIQVFSIFSPASCSYGTAAGSAAYVWRQRHWTRRAPGSNQPGVRRLRRGADGLRREALARGDSHRAELAVAMHKLPGSQLALYTCALLGEKRKLISRRFFRCFPRPSLPT